MVVRKREIVEHESSEKSEYDIKYPLESTVEKRKGEKMGKGGKRVLGEKALIPFSL